MSNLLSSASKIVFIIMAIGVNISFFIGILDAKDYMLLASMSFTFYFSNKGNVTEDFAGK